MELTTPVFYNLLLIALSLIFALVCVYVIVSHVDYSLKRMYGNQAEEGDFSDLFRKSDSDETSYFRQKFGIREHEREHIARSNPTELF